MTWPLGRIGWRQQQKGLLLGGWSVAPHALAPSRLQQMESGEKRLEYRRAQNVLFLSQQPLHTTFFCSWLSHTHHGGKSPNIFGSYHLSFSNPGSSSLGEKKMLFKNSTGMAKWVGDMQNSNPNSLSKSQGVSGLLTNTFNPIFGSGKRPSSNQESSWRHRFSTWEPKKPIYINARKLTMFILGTGE